MTRRREIVLINKDESGPPRLIDKIEQLSKIAAAIALPLIVAVGGWWIQDALSTRDTNQDYVELAISILSRPQEETQAELREWAANLLAATSPIDIPDSLRDQLGGGEIQLPEPRTAPDFVPASSLPRSDPRAALTGAIARIDIRTERGGHACTAWLLTAFHMVTARHCIEMPDRAARAATALFGFSSPTSLDTAASVDVALPPVETHESLDYAILEIGGETVPNRIPLPISPVAPAIGDPLFILHHPRGGELAYSPEPCAVLAVDGAEFLHDCETTAGSSGAPLIHAETLEVIGINLGLAAEESTKYGVSVFAIARDSEMFRTLLDPAR